MAAILQAMISNAFSWKKWLSIKYLIDFVPSGPIDSKLAMVQVIMTSWRRHEIETFSTLLAFCEGIHRSPVDSPLKDQWCEALMFSLINAWTNDRANNRDADDLRRHRAHYDVTVKLGVEQATEHYLKQWWLSSLTPHTVTWPHWATAGNDYHFSDVIMSAVASQITSLMIVTLPSN